MHAEVAVDRAGQELRPAEVDADHAPGRHVGHHTPLDAGPGPPWGTSPRGASDVHEVPRAARGFLSRSPRSGESPLDELRRGGAAGAHGARQAPPAVDLGPRRALGRWSAIAGWILLSRRALPPQRPDPAGQALGESPSQLGGGGVPPIGATNILVLGSDQRTKETERAGRVDERARAASDSIMLMRVGGGHNCAPVDPARHRRRHPRPRPRQDQRRLRDRRRRRSPSRPSSSTSASTSTTSSRSSFENFPELIDAMGGIDYTGGCVVSRINGGFRNGGYTLRLRRARRTSTASRRSRSRARARTSATPARTTCTRARRQQKIFSAMKDRLTSPGAFIRLPLISWNAPQGAPVRHERPDAARPVLGARGLGRPGDARPARERRNGTGLIVDATRSGAPCGASWTTRTGSSGQPARRFRLCG